MLFTKNNQQPMGPTMELAMAIVKAAGYRQGRMPSHHDLSLVELLW